MERLLRLPQSSRLAALFGLVVAELVAITLLYTLTVRFECVAVASPLFCSEVSLLATRALLVAGALALAALARPGIAAPLAAAPPPERAGRWLALHGLGVALILAPWPLLERLGEPGIFTLTVTLWAIGAALAAVGGLAALAPAGAWRKALAAGGWPLAALVLGAALLPEAVTLAEPAWHSGLLTDTTFAAARALAEAVGSEVEAEPARHVLGIDGFSVRIGEQCSGIEGLVLITAFLSGYLWLFRAELRFPLVLALIPIGLVLSWTLNVVRIVVLLAIGANGAPELAIGGFHSHAGWLMFSLLAVGTIAVSQSLPVLRRAPSGPARGEGPPPLRSDPVAAEILPFTAFMAAALVVSTFASAPALWYPVKAAAMLAALLAFRPLLVALPWRLDPLSLGLGAAIGVLWVALSGPADPEAVDVAAALGPAAFALWAVVRVISTSLLVPVVEELFFRGYLLRRLGERGGAWRWVAVAASTAAFAALHSRWELAALAGVVYAVLVLRSGRVTDAILAHVASNAVIAAWAVATGAWHAI